MKSRVVTVGVMMGGLALGGVCLRSLESAGWARLQELDAAGRLESTSAASEQALVQGALGALRAGVADLVWLRLSKATEDHDLPATESLLRLVSVVDPRSQYFWINGARIVAYDLPVWQIDLAGGYGRVSAVAQEQFIRGQATRALLRLDEAMTFHPSSAALWIERANIQFTRLGDVAGAAESYRRASQQPAAPYFAARLHAELLRRLGRKAEALAWLTKLHPMLPAADESAGADLVLARIRVLERELMLPADRVDCPR
ncbi:MAG: hypothetical protein ABI222_16850 [Opitutaceae bacterium]